MGIIRPRSMVVRLHAVLCAVLLLCLLVSCVSRPLPIPPTLEPEVDSDKVIIQQLDTGPSMAVEVKGEAGAIDPPGTVIRVTYVDLEIPQENPRSQEVVTEDDGSFTVNIEGTIPGVYYFEAILEDEDLYFAALRIDADRTISAVDPGPDSDGDGSPDAIDCAPDDEAVGGQRCL